MVSVLAAQLERLKAAAAPSAPAVRGKPSLLFTYQAAADVDVDTIYHLALAGLRDLVSRDSRFAEFETTLFSRDLLTQNRDQHTKEWNDKISSVISSFLHLLSNHFLQPAAFKTLEYLIRRFRVHELEVADLLQCSLPYHTTNEFVRLVQLLALQNTPGEFLHRVQSNGAALPRETLVKRCSSDKALLRFICEGALTAARPDVANRTYLSFFAVTTCETLSHMKKVKEDTLALLLPYMLAGLQRGVISDLRAASIMIFSQLAARTALSHKLLTKMLQRMVKAAEPRDTRVLALILAQVAASQPHLTVLPPKFLKAAFKLPGLPEDLSSVAASAPTPALLRLLSTSLAAALPTHPALAAPFAAFTQATPLPAALARELAATLLRSGAALASAANKPTDGQDNTQADDQESSEDKADKARAGHLRVLRVLEQRYPGPVDAAINALLGQAAAAAPGGKRATGDAEDSDEDMDSGGDDVEEGGEGDREKVYAFVKEAFHGGLHCPLEGGEEAGLSSMTLASAMDAPAASVRAMAIQQLGALLDQDATPQATSSVTRTAAEACLVRRLEDDDWSVVAAVLGLRVVPELPLEPLVEALAGVVRHGERAAGTLPEAESAAKKAISILASLLTQDNLLTVAPPLLPYLLTSPSTRRVSHAALRRLSTSTHPLFAHLPTPSKPSKKTPSSSSSTTPAPANDPDTPLNQATIKALAKAITADPTALLPPLTDLAQSTTPAGRHLLLLALAHATAAPALPPADAPLLANAIITIVTTAWPEATAGLSSTVWLSQANALFTPDCLPLPPHTAALPSPPADFHPIAHLTALHAAATALATHTPPDSSLPPALDALLALEPLEPLLPHLAALLARHPAPTTLPPLARRLATTPHPHAAAALARLMADLAAHPDTLPDTIKFIAPHTLAALASPHPPLRAAALALAQSATHTLRRPPATGPLGAAPHIADLLALLTANAPLISSEPSAAPALVAAALTRSPTPPSKAPAATPKTPRGKKNATTPATDPAAPPKLSDASISAVTTFLTSCLSSQQGPAATPVAATLLACLAPALPPATLLKSSLPQLERLASPPPPSLPPADARLAASILALVTPATPRETPQALALLLPLLAPTAAPPLRSAALAALTPELYTALAPEQQHQAFIALLAAAGGDPDADCRAMARACLEAAPVAAATLLPLLAPADDASAAAAAAAATPNKRRRRRQSQAEDTPAAAPPSTTASALPPLRQAIEVLEMLQWKTPLPAPLPSLVPALQALAARLLPTIGTIVVSHSETDAATPEPDAATPPATASPDGAAAPPTEASLAGYAVQLSLGALKRVLEEGGEAAALSVDARAVVATAQAAPDAAVRNAALLVVAALAAARPLATLDHVLEVVAVVNEAAVAQEDAYSSGVATAAMTSVVPAWLAAGRSAGDLWHAVASRLGPLTTSRRLAMMSTLLDVMPQESGLHVALLCLMRLAVPTPAANGNTDASSDASSTWAPELAAALSLKVPAGARLQAFSQMLEATLVDQTPQAALPRTAAAFVTAQLQVKALQVAARKLLTTTEVAPVQLAELQAGGEGLMRSCLAQLQAVGAAPEARGAAARALQAAAAGLYGLLKALEGVMPSDLYIQALVQLQGPESTDACRRRTLRLLATKLASVPQELEDLNILAPAKKDDRRAAISAAALTLPPALPPLLDRALATPTTRQAALIAADALFTHFPHAPAALAPTLPSIVAAASDASPVVRASALTALATAARALGPRGIVAHLPPAVKAILASATSASAALAAASPSDRSEPSPDAPAADGDDNDDNTEHADGNTMQTSDDDTTEDAVQRRRAYQHQVYILAAALAAIESLVRHAPTLMSPYLPPTLALLLTPAVLTCPSPHCAAFGARLRAALPTALPPRILLAPVYAHLDPALAHGPAPTEALLELSAAAASAMDPPTAATHHEHMFTFLLRALEARQLQPPALVADAADGGGVFRVEAAAVKATVALVMKLSEAKFKPLFVRLMEWTTSSSATASAAGAGAGQPPRPPGNSGRVCTLMVLAEALTERLRSVFVPYFKHLLDVALHSLSSASGAVDSKALKRLKKKARRDSAAGLADPASAGTPGGAAADAAAAASAAGGGVELETAWVARVKTVRALHRCFLYDTVEFLTTERFNRLLPALVAQLDLEPPAEVAAVLQQQCSDAGLDAMLAQGAADRLDLPARAAVGALVQMAVAANSDVLWKPLNQQALMMTRAGAARTRLAALEVSAQLVERVREEYLVLLPESIPFLAELLEDTDAGVEARTQEVVRALEELSGEKLDEYLR